MDIKLFKLALASKAKLLKESNEPLLEATTKLFDKRVVDIIMNKFMVGLVDEDDIQIKNVKVSGKSVKNISFKTLDDSSGNGEFIDCILEPTSSGKVVWVVNITIKHQNGKKSKKLRGIPFSSKDETKSLSELESILTKGSKFIHIWDLERFAKFLDELK